MPILRKLSVALIAGLAVGSAFAFPDKLVKIVVPYPAGGIADVSARIVAERLTAAWGQSVIVENKPGATGAIGTELVAKSPADGYTILYAVPIMLATELARPSVNYRTLRDFVAVSTVFTSPIVYVASTSAPAGGLKEVLAAGGAQPGLLNYGHHGDGTTTHYMGEKLRKITGVDMVPVPYNGDGPIFSDLLGGHLKTGFLSGPTGKKAEDTGKARMVAVASAKRSPLMPAVPTFTEQGIEGFDRETWGKLFVPKGTPDAVVDKIARDVSKIMQGSDVQSRFATMGLVGVGGTSAQTQQDVQSDYVYWVRLIKEFGVLTKP